MNKENQIDKREEERKIGLANLETSMVDLATAYFVDVSNRYGEAGSSAVEQFIYKPILGSKEGQGFLYESLVNSRSGGKRYSGNISEYKILENVAGLIQKSIRDITVADAMNLLGSNTSIQEKYKNAYIGDLMQSDDKEEKQMGEMVFGTYQETITNTSVSKALEERSKYLKSGLEETLKEAENESR